MRLWALILSIAVIFGATPAPAATKSINVVSKSPRVGNLTLYQNSWAVLIGINDYKNKDIPDLKFAKKDVADMRRSLLRLGFPSNQVITLTGRRATKENILSVLGDQLPRRVGRSDRVLVYFSGHGKDEKVGGRERGYLIPSDGDPSRLYATAVSMTSLQEIAERMNTRHVLFMADACYSGFIGFDNKSIRNRGLLGDLVRKPAIQILTAGTSGQQAIERDGNGLFTKILLQGLAGARDPRQSGGYGDHGRAFGHSLPPA